METLIRGMFHWWWTWVGYGLSSITVYVIIGAVITLAINAVLEWITSHPQKTVHRFVTSLVAGVLWPIPLALVSVAVVLLPIAIFAGALWKWQQLNAKGREKAAEIIQDRADRNRMLMSGAAGEDWGNPTPESKSTVERLLIWRS